MNIIQWLNKKTNTYCDSTNKDLIDTIFISLFKLIQKHNKLHLNINFKEMNQLFYIFLYDTSLFEKTSCELLDIEFTDQIVDLYIHSKEISDNYGTDLFYKNCTSSDELLIFLSICCSYYEETNYDEEQESYYTDEYYNISI